MEINKLTLLKSIADDVENTQTHLIGVIKGVISPCSMCIGCETEDSRVGMCSSFILRNMTQRVIKDAAE